MTDQLLGPYQSTAHSLLLMRPLSPTTISSRSTRPSETSRRTARLAAFLAFRSSLVSSRPSIIFGAFTPPVFDVEASAGIVVVAVMLILLSKV